MSELRRLVREIHRRSLWQVALTYLGLSWAVLQVVEHVIEQFRLPPWVYGAAVVALLVGLPVVIATAVVQAGPPGAHPRDGAADDAGSRADGATAGAGSGHAARGAEDGEGLELGDVFRWRNAVLGGVTAGLVVAMSAGIWYATAGPGLRDAGGPGPGEASITGRNGGAGQPVTLPDTVAGEVGSGDEGEPGVSDRGGRDSSAGGGARARGRGGADAGGTEPAPRETEIATGEDRGAAAPPTNGAGQRALARPDPGDTMPAGDPGEETTERGRPAEGAADEDMADRDTADEETAAPVGPGADSAGAVSPSAEADAPAERGPSAREVVDATVSRLRRAIEGEDLDSLRAVWVTISAEEVGSFERFFRSARDLRVTFDLDWNSLRSSDRRIEVTSRTRWTFYSEATGETREQSPFEQRLVLERRGESWVVVEY